MDKVTPSLGQEICQNQRHKWKSAPAQDESEALLPGFARDGCQTARQLKSTAEVDTRQ